MNVNVIRSVADLDILRSEWDTLATLDRRNGLFRSAAWVVPWFRFVQSDAQPLIITVRDPAGKLVGLAPFCRRRFADLGFRMSAIGFAGREVVSGDYLGIVAAEEFKAEVYALVLEVLWQSRELWQALIAGEVICGSDLDEALNTWGRRHKLALRCQEHRKCPYICLPGTFEEYLAGLSGGFRKKLRYETRAVLERGGGSIKMYSCPKHIGAALDILSSLHLKRWHQANQPGTMGRPGFISFLKEVSSNPPIGAGACVYMLEHNATAVAGLLAFHCGESCFYYQTGWDTTSPFSRFSQGDILLAHAIEDAISKGLRYFDFLRGDETYKDRWTDLYRATSTMIFARTAIARGYIATARAKDAVKKLIRKA